MKRTSSGVFFFGMVSVLKGGDGGCEWWIWGFRGVGRRRERLVWNMGPFVGGDGELGGGGLAVEAQDVDVPDGGARW